MNVLDRAADSDLRFDRDGAELVPGRLDSDAVQRTIGLLADQLRDVAGVRLFGSVALRPLLNIHGMIGSIAGAFGDDEMRPVRAILFDKTPAANWALPWHQDRVIAVRERIEVAGFGPWSRKHGALHVAPPFDVLARMVTLRVHLDEVNDTNAPLLIAPGSHRMGRIAEREIAGAIATCGTVSCLAAAGDVWVYSTPVLHASERANRPERRRVLQVDYAACDLPGGLSWLGV